MKVEECMVRHGNKVSIRITILLCSTIRLVTTSTVKWAFLNQERFTPVFLHTFKSLTLTTRVTAITSRGRLAIVWTLWADQMALVHQYFIKRLDSNKWVQETTTTVFTREERRFLTSKYLEMRRKLRSCGDWLGMLHNCFFSLFYQVKLQFTSLF